MKLLLTFILIISSTFSLFATAKSTVRSKAGESISVQCLESIAEAVCEEFQVDIKSNQLTKSFNVSRGEYLIAKEEIDYFASGSLKLYEGTQYGAALPIAIAMLNNAGPIGFLGAVVATPATLAIGLSYDVIMSPVKIARNIKNKKLDKAVKGLFEQEDYQKKLSKKNFKSLVFGVYYSFERFL